MSRENCGARESRKNLTKEKALARRALPFFGAPGEIGSNRLETILGSSTRRRYAPAPKTLSRFVEQEFSSDLGALLSEKGTHWVPFSFSGAPGEIRTPDRPVRS